MLREIEYPLLVRFDQIEIAPIDDQLIAQGGAAGHDFTRWGNDRRLANLADAFLDASLGNAHDPAAILIRARLHAQQVVKVAEMINLRLVGNMIGSVVTQQDQLR